MNGLIIFKGKYRATRDYAQWLSEELSLPLLSTDDAKATDIINADFLLIGTSVYYGKFKIQKWLKENVLELKNKKIFLFIVCRTGDDEKEKQNKLAEDNLPSKLKEQCEMYFLPGRLIHEELTWIHKISIYIVGRFEKDLKRKEALQKDIDEVRKENLLSIIKAVYNYNEGFCHLDFSL